MNDLSEKHITFPAPASPSSEEDQMDDCWNRMGNAGDGSCPELPQVVLCRNCPVYYNTGRTLFEREAPEEYVAEWTELLSRHKAAKISGKTAAIVFRLGVEWLSLPTRVFKEVAPMRPVHSLPHRSGHILKGLVNIDGALRLCVSMHNLLGIEESREVDRRKGRKVYERLVVIEKSGEFWVFPVDEVHGMHRFDQDELQNVPITVARSGSSYTKGLFPCEDMTVAYLDDELLFYSLKRSVL